MIKACFQFGESSIIVPGLTQWDYGQILEIYGLDVTGNAEVHFALRRKQTEAVITQPEVKENVLSVRIPDMLLETGEEIAAYVYVADADSGETVRTIHFPVKRRQKPGDYDSPAEKNLLRQLMETVHKKADSLELDESGEYLQLLSEGTPVGNRIRLPSSTGREIEIKNDGVSICWRYTDSNDWNELIRLDDLRGEDGKPPEFEMRDGHLWAVYPD